MNPLGVLFIGATLGLGYWLYQDATAKEEKEKEPTKPKLSDCPITYDMIAAFSKEQGLDTWYVEAQAVATWSAPKKDFASNPKARAWSQLDCGFYSWNGKAWIPDLLTDVAFAKTQGIEL